MWMVFVVNMSKQRGTLPPSPSLQKQTEDANTQHAEDEMRFIFFKKGKRHANRDKGKQENERLHGTCSSVEGIDEAKQVKYRGYPSHYSYCH